MTTQYTVNNKLMLAMSLTLVLFGFIVGATRLLHGQQPTAEVYALMIVGMNLYVLARVDHALNRTRARIQALEASNEGIWKRLGTPQAKRP